MLVVLVSVIRLLPSRLPGSDISLHPDSRILLPIMLIMQSMPTDPNTQPGAQPQTSVIDREVIRCPQSVHSFKSTGSLAPISRPSKPPDLYCKFTASCSCPPLTICFLLLKHHYQARCVSLLCYHHGYIRFHA